MNERPLSGYIAVIAASALWGLSGIFVRFILAGANFGPLSLAFWRDLLTFAALFVGLMLLRPAWLRVEKRDLPWLAAVGVSVGAFHVFWNLAVFVNGPAVATVQQAAMPAVVAIIAWFLWRESLGWRKLLAIIFTFSGTVLVSNVGLLSQTNLNLFGLLTGLGLPLAYASWNLFGKKVRRRYGVLTVLTYGFGFGALALLPFQFFVPFPWPAPLSTWLWFAALIFVPTIGAWYAYMFGLGRLPASVASILSMMEIPFVAVYAYLLLNELMTLTQAIGAVMVIIGVSLLFRQKNGV
ncbi:MAG TPA: EamA family transporter [Chloroflexi bacterium]|nr:EamA family transporter [Chloroflexota bacterium]